ncbi:MAG: hypothetical protein KBT46_00060 [Ruminococcus sp.]|nr:hypothetical protein [Candidatus Copronaster equi]
MKRKLNKVLCIIFALLMCCICGITAFAAEPVSVNVDVEVKLDGAKPDTPEEYLLVLKSVDTGREYVCTVNGENKATFDISFSNVGVYNYTVTQKKGNNANCTYDDTVYYLTITVFYGNNSYDFDIAAKVYKDGVDEKQDAIIFENIYKEVTTQSTTEKSEERTEPITKVVTEKPSAATENVTTAQTHQNPNTGDNSGLPMWLGLFAIGIVFAASSFIVLVPKKKDSEEIN